MSDDDHSDRADRCRPSRPRVTGLEAQRPGLNVARFDLVSMRLAVLCAESGSLSAAAKRAHCSVSAGSQRLSALEGALGKPLFLRDHRGLHLTAAGELFVRHARAILGQLQVLSEEVARAAGIVDPCREPRPAVATDEAPSRPVQPVSLAAARLQLALTAWPGGRTPLAALA